MNATITLPSSVLKQIEQDARNANKSLNNYIEEILYDMGYRPYNPVTAQACEDARKGIGRAGRVDTSSVDAFLTSVLDD